LNLDEVRRGGDDFTRSHSLILNLWGSPSGCATLLAERRLRENKLAAAIDATDGTIRQL
jgi:hypothetical protein